MTKGSIAAFSFHPIFVENTTMAKGAAMKKAAANKAMTKGSIADSLANSVVLKKSVTTKVLNSLAELGQAEVKKTRHLHYPRTRQDQDAQKASHKGIQEDDVRQGSCRESQASQDCRQGICSGRTQSSNLMTPS